MRRRGCTHAGTHYIGKASAPGDSLVANLELRQLSVWLTPLTAQQLADLHAYMKAIWGM
jgi:hypothetical protein